VKQVQPAQLFDVEAAREIVQQLERSKQMKAECDLSPITEVDLAKVLSMVLLQTPDLLDRVYKCRWSAANRTYGRYELSRGNTRDLC
jgi:hypothetical protein